MNKVTQILKSRGLDWIATHLPYHRGRYAALGLASAPKNSSGSKAFEETDFGVTSTEVKVPAEIYSQTSDFMHRDNYAEEKALLTSTGERKAWRIRKGRVYSANSRQYYVLNAQRRIVAGASYDHDVAQAGKGADDLRMEATFFPDPHYFSGKAVSLILGGGPAINIFHWMMDALPRLALIAQVCPLDEIDHFLVGGKDSGFRGRTLELLGIPTSKIHYFTEQLVHVQADELLVASHPRGWFSNISPQWSLDFHRQHYLPVAQNLDREWPTRIYISRKDSSLRGVENEAELMAYLKPLGYEEIVLSEYAYEEKVALFHHADEIVSMSGAAFAFLAFSRPETRVLELFPSGFVHYANTALADQSGLDYHYLIFGSEGADLGGHNAQRQTMTIDLERVQAVINDWS